MQILVGISFRGKLRMPPSSVSGISSEFMFIQSFRKMRPNLSFRGFFSFFGLLVITEPFSSKIVWIAIKHQEYDISGTTCFIICSIWSKEANSFTFPSFLKKIPGGQTCLFFFLFAAFHHHRFRGDEDKVDSITFFRGIRLRECQTMISQVSLI